MPSGAFVGLSFAAAISAALVLARLHRRRRYQPTSHRLDSGDGRTRASGLEPAEPPLAPIVRSLRRAHLASLTTGDPDAEPDKDTPGSGGGPLDTHAPSPRPAGPPWAAASGQVVPSWPLPPGVIHVGARDGEQIPLDVAALGGLGLTGPGVDAAARHLLVGLLAAGGPGQADEQVEVLIPAGDLARLLDQPGADLPSLPRLTVTPSLDEALTALEAELVRRGRIVAAHEAGDLPGLRERAPEEEPLPTLVLLATPRPGAHHRLRAVLGLGAHLGIAGVLLAEWPHGLTCQVDARGVVTRTTGTPAGPDTGSRLVGVRLFGLPDGDTRGLLALLRAARGLPDNPSDQRSTRPPTPARPAPPPTSGPARAGRAGTPEQGDAAEQGRAAPDRAAAGQPVRATAPASSPTTPSPGPWPVAVYLFGPPRVHARGREIATGLRRKARELLAYLALHPQGLSAEAIVDAVWAEVDPEAAVKQFRTNLGNLRAVLREATGAKEPMFITYAGGRYRLDPTLVEVDVWRFQAALADAARARDDAARAALQQAVDLYAGDLVERCYDEWAEPFRAEIRRQAVDAHTRLAELYEATEPERALQVLEKAATHDRYNEHLYQRIMRLQARLHRPDAIRRTLRLLEERLAELDLEPEDDTADLAAALLHEATGPATPATAARARPPGGHRPQAATPNGARRLREEPPRGGARRGECP